MGMLMKNEIINSFFKVMKPKIPVNMKIK